MTQGGNGTTPQGDIINDPDNFLNGQFDHLTKDDFKERLIVAEKVMKSLFQRNKDLEDKVASFDGQALNQSQKGTAHSSHTGSTG